MIKNLFEEYKYFPQYPEKELHITAQVTFNFTLILTFFFGNVIRSF
jgi:hypothetical protein